MKQETYDRLSNLYNLRHRFEEEGLNESTLQEYMDILSDTRRKRLAQDAINHINAEIVQIFEEEFNPTQTLVHP